MSHFKNNQHQTERGHNDMNASLAEERKMSMSKNHKTDGDDENKDGAKIEVEYTFDDPLKGIEEEGLEYESSSNESDDSEDEEDNSNEFFKITKHQKKNK